MIIDKNWVFCIGFGVFIISSVLYLEYNQVSGWYDVDLHNFALPFLLATGIGMIFYSYARTDHIENNDRLDDLEESIESIHEDVHELREEIRKISNLISDVKQIKEPNNN